MKKVKQNKIVIIGFGSIGQRHYKNLLSLGFKSVYAYDVDRKKLKDRDIKTVKNINVKTLRDFDVAFVCNPNNLHIKTAINCAKADCHLFIEKPLSHNLAGIKELENLCKKKKIINFVACNMRFVPCLQFIKKYLEKKGLGKVYSIYHELGYYLPYWRPGTDYRKNYAVKKSTGGGIILDDIHEFDLLFWLNGFKEVKESKFIFNKASDLDLSTEDNCIASFKFNNKVLGSVKCDYLQKIYSRGCKIVGEKGNLEWDFKDNIVWLKNNNGNRKLFAVKKYDLNKMYIDEVKYFFNCLSNGRRTFNDVKVAGQVLKYCVDRK
jgi:predicted dehydrogenase